MPATRLLLIADAKALPTLASGLLAGAPFEISSAALTDRAAAQEKAETADGVVIFLAAPAGPLPAALQALSPKVRERGGRMVVVLQREHLSRRDDCFRAGASDVLVLPMANDQFVARLKDSVELAWPQEKGAPAQVTVATRTASTKPDQATVSPAGAECVVKLPIKPGETVRLSWAKFQAWGLVVRGTPSAQIRFAGLSSEEEAQIRGWLKQGAPAAAPDRAAAAAPDRAAAAAPSPPAPPAFATSGARAAPAIGPPPGFADRKPVRAAAPPAARPPPAAGAAKSSPPPDPSSHPPEGASHGNGALQGAALSPPPADSAPGEDAPERTVKGAERPEDPAAIWPGPFDEEACKDAARQYLKDRTAPEGASEELAAAAKKVTQLMGSAERSSLEREPDSWFAHVLAVRVGLELANSEGARLQASAAPASVDAGAVAALVKQADEAAARLQEEASSAVTKGEVESLQMITATRAALGRELGQFKEVGQRLGGHASAPRVGSGALDPEFAVPGQGPRPAAKTIAAPAPARAELRDFHGLDSGPGRGKTILMVVTLAAFILALANALYFGVPHHRELTPEAAGKGVERIDVSGDAALVTISPEWLAAAENNLPQLAGALREASVKKAVLTLPNGRPAGILDVATGKVSGLARPKGAQQSP